MLDGADDTISMTHRRKDKMRRLGIMVIALAFFTAGMAMAEPGIPKVNEVQGLSISTTVDA